MTFLIFVNFWGIVFVKYRTVTYIIVRIIETVNSIFFSFWAIIRAMLFNISYFVILTYLLLMGAIKVPT